MTELDVRDQMRYPDDFDNWPWGLASPRPAKPDRRWSRNPTLIFAFNDDLAFPCFLFVFSRWFSFH